MSIWSFSFTDPCQSTRSSPRSRLSRRSVGNGRQDSKGVCQVGLPNGVKDVMRWSRDLAPLFLIVIPGTALVGWMSWTMLSILLAHKPMLLINREGIVVSSMPLLSGFSISWGEIEAIFPSRYSRYKFLCIVPKNPDHYLKTHFNGFGRFYRQSNSRVGSPLYIPQINLAKQVEEILQQVSHTYASEVSYYHVQVRSYPQDVLS